MRAQAGSPQFTCFTGTKVQILTQSIPNSPQGRPNGYGSVTYTETDPKQRVRFAGEFEEGKH
jgi:hypothetical protein